MEIMWKILSKIRYLVCLAILAPFGVLTIPLTLFFRWNGFWILLIANHEGCTLSEAKQLLHKGKYKIIYENSTESNFNNSASTSSFDYEHINTPAYKHLPFNIYHKN